MQFHFKITEVCKFRLRNNKIVGFTLNQNRACMWSFQMQFHFKSTEVCKFRLGNNIIVGFTLNQNRACMWSLQMQFHFKKGDYWRTDPSTIKSASFGLELIKLLVSV